MNPDDDKPAPPVMEARTPSVRRSLALSFAARATTSLVTLGASMILARLLTPAETGIYAVGFAVMMLLEMLREFGVGSYLIRERELDRGKIRAAFTVTLLLAWCPGGALVAASRPLAT